MSSNEADGWIVNGVLGHKVWKDIRRSAQVRFPDGIAILAKLKRFGDDTNLIRHSANKYDDAEDWAEPFSLMNPEMRMGFNFSYKVNTDDPKGIHMAVYGRTKHGANFVHEFRQERNEKAQAIIRVPVPDELREEALELESKYPLFDMVREQAGAFSERFNVTDETPPPSYWEPHLESKEITDREQIYEVFEGVLDVVERGVRAST